MLATSSPGVLLPGLWWAIPTFVAGGSSRPGGLKRKASTNHRASKKELAREQGVENVVNVVGVQKCGGVHDEPTKTFTKQNKKTPICKNFSFGS